MQTSLLIGKTISSAQLMRKAAFDDTGYLELSFTDGTRCVIAAGYSSYTGESEGEYPTFLKLMNDLSHLEPANKNPNE